MSGKQTMGKLNMIGPLEDQIILISSCLCEVLNLLQTYL